MVIHISCIRLKRIERKGERIKRKGDASSAHFAELKQFQSEINVGQLMNHDNIRMISDDQISSSLKKITKTPQCCHNMLLDFLASIRQFGLHMLFLFCCWIPLDWNNPCFCSPLWKNTYSWTSKCNGLECKGEIFENKSSYCGKANRLCIQAILR